MPTKLQSYLENNSINVQSISPILALRGSTINLDLSNRNPELKQIDVSDTATFTNYVFSKIKSAGAVAAIGGYNEERVIYGRSAHFAGSEPRSVHLGVDVWMEAGTTIAAPLAGSVHSFRDNAGYGDYGPTIILQHELERITFYTLYGHLSRTSLSDLYKGKKIAAGAKLGEIGPYPENGDWPPHLHFQIITDMRGLEGDFPGVAAPSQRDYYLSICPDQFSYSAV